MSGFSKEWLALREDVDLRSRNREVTQTLAARFALREHVTVVDLGSGTGANLRATAPLLPAKQTWVLAERDSSLIAIARNRLKAWADSNEDTADGLRLRKGHSDIGVLFVETDLALDLAAVFHDGDIDLVTASAFFDLTSPAFIKKVVQQSADRRAGFYAALTYNGVQRWSPHRPLDNQMSAAFHRHQLSDKGFGPAAGPMASAEIADQLRMADYTVLEGESPWDLDRGDRMLIDELVRGHAFAVAETGLIGNKQIEDWVRVQRTGAIVGHSDLFATPV